MNVTIIGCGWLGFPLGITLMDKGHQVFGSTKDVNKLSTLENKGIHPFLFDLGSNPMIPSEITSATDILIVTLPPLQKQKIHFYGEKLVEICKQFTSVQGVIFTSSTGVYPQKDGDFNEDYVFSKDEKQSSLFQAETALRKELENKLTTVRLAGLIGPNRHPVLQLQGRTGLKNPECPVNLVHQTDVISIITLLIDRQKFGDVFNVVHPDLPKRKRKYTAMALKNELVPPEFDNTTGFRRTINGQKIEDFCDFQFKNSIE